MANTIPSPNMSMPVPVAGVDPGPQWALDINSCLAILDAHDHTPGAGAQITPGGINISSDLTFGGNNATALRSTRYTPQSPVLAGALDLDCIFVNGVDLYYNDGNGNHVRITQSGGVAGSPGSIANLTSPASASYVSGNSTFVWQSAANTPANMDFASAILRNLSANSFGLTLNPPSAMGADFALTLPTVPASQKFMTLDAAGVMGAPWAVDNSTIEVASGTTVQLKDGGITSSKFAAGAVNTSAIADLSITTSKYVDLSVTTGKIADGAITNVKLASLNQQIGTSSGTFSVSGTSETNIPGSSVTITTSGRPVFIGFMPSGSFGEADFNINSSNGLLNTILTRIYNGATEIGRFPIVTINANFSIPTSTVWMIDTPIAGTYTYKGTLQPQAASVSGQFNNSKIVVYEI